MMSGTRYAAMLLVTAALFACSAPTEVRMNGTSSIAHRTDEVFVGERGAVVLNGKPIDAAALAPELAKLKAAHGVVWYSRENMRSAQATDAQMVVFKIVVAAGVPISLFTDGTFTHHADP